MFNQTPKLYYVVDYLYNNNDLISRLKNGGLLNQTEIYKYLLSKHQILSYNHVIKIINFLERNNYVKRVKEGSYTLVELTKNGSKLGEHIHYLLYELEYKE